MSVVILHPSVAGFDSGADDYERGRPTYPPDAVSWLAEVLGIGPGTTVVDLAAGTGKLTRLLVPTGARVLAVEPIAGMRDRLVTLVPDATVCDGTAEAMALPTSSADAVTVGQAFHWFRGPEALAEIHRVLAPSGRLGLLWNRRDLTQPIQVELHEIINRRREDTPAHMSGAWKRAFHETELFSDLVMAQFPMRQVLDANGLIARVLSISFIAKLSGADRDRVIADVQSILERYGNPVTLQHITDCYWCEAI